MTPSAAGSTLLDRMVARVAEPPLALPFALPAPAVWSEEMVEQSTPAPAPVVESREPEPLVRPTQTVETMAPPIVTPAREVPPALPLVQPAFLASLSVSPQIPEPKERIVEVPGRTEMMTRETTVLVPVRSPQVSPRAIHSSAPSKMPLNIVLPPLDARSAEVFPTFSKPSPQRKQPAPSAVHPDLPLSLPMREIVPSVAVQPEQVIHVTIGRLEVRTPERERKPRAAERKAAPPGPTLEQYLAKRRGGGAS